MRTRRTDLPRKPRQNKQTSDDRARDEQNLTVSSAEGCQLFRKKVLCGLPIFVILRGAKGKVGICIECWERALEIADDAHVDRQELREKYEPRPKALRRRIA